MRFLTPTKCHKMVFKIFVSYWQINLKHVKTTFKFGDIITKHYVNSLNNNSWVKTNSRWHVNVGETVLNRVGRLVWNSTIAILAFTDMCHMIQYQWRDWRQLMQRSSLSHARSCLQWGSIASFLLVPVYPCYVKGFDPVDQYLWNANAPQHFPHNDTIKTRMLL